MQRVKYVDEHINTTTYYTTLDSFSWSDFQITMRYIMRWCDVWKGYPPISPPLRRHHEVNNFRAYPIKHKSVNHFSKRSSNNTILFQKLIYIFRYLIYLRFNVIITFDYAVWGPFIVSAFTCRSPQNACRENVLITWRI